MDRVGFDADHASWVYDPPADYADTLAVHERRIDRCLQVAGDHEIAHLQKEPGLAISAFGCVGKAADGPGRIKLFFFLRHSISFLAFIRERRSASVRRRMATAASDEARIVRVIRELLIPVKRK
jgi:hypothetical protein